MCVCVCHSSKSSSRELVVVVVSELCISTLCVSVEKVVCVLQKKKGGGS